MSTERVMIVDDGDLDFMIAMMEAQGAKVTKKNNGDGTWTVTATYPDKKTATEMTHLVQPAPLATADEDEAKPEAPPPKETIPEPLLAKSFAELAEEYRRNYDLFKINPGHEDEIGTRVGKLIASKSRYIALAAKTGIPWQFIAILHMMESNANFLTHLHNGDPLTARTVRVPIGRPQGNPPFQWEDSALDALKYEGFTGLDDWNVASMLYRFEKYNGMGYRGNHVYSPYLWSYTNLYEKGRYVGDHHYDAESVSKQCGAAILLKRLLAA